jgi:integrase
MRRAELCGLLVGDLTRVAGYWVLSHRIKGSGEDEVISRLRPAAYEAVRGWLDASGPRPNHAPLFVAILKRGRAKHATYVIDDPMRPLSHGVIAKRLGILMARAGIHRPQALSAHSIRRSLITNALETSIQAVSPLSIVSSPAMPTPSLLQCTS